MNTRENKYEFSYRILDTDNAVRGGTLMAVYKRLCHIIVATGRRGLMAHDGRGRRIYVSLYGDDYITDAAGRVIWRA